MVWVFVEVMDLVVALIAVGSRCGSCGVNWVISGGQEYIYN